MTSYPLVYSISRNEAWRKAAACAGKFRVFFPNGSEDDKDAEIEAKAFCHRCPVRSECLAAALDDEGDADARTRVGVRGGLSRLERARLAGAAEEPSQTAADAELDRLLHLGTMTDRDIAATLGRPVVIVHRRRHFLGLPTLQQRITPADIFAAKARPIADGHVEWATDALHPVIQVGGRQVVVARYAFSVGHGRDPEGILHRTCGYSRCVAWEHLADRVIRADAREHAGAREEVAA